MLTDTPFDASQTPPDISRRAAAAAVLLLAAIAATVALLQASAKPFWYDELITVTVSGLPDSTQIREALRSGVDGNPPTFYLVTRALSGLAADPHVGYRLPALFGFLVAAIAIYLAVARRAGRLPGLAAAMFFVNTPAADFAYEARPYGLVLGCVAVAVVAWQRAGDRPWFAGLLAVALAAATSSHYYAILAWPAFIAAEASIMLTTRRLRIAVWLALIPAVIPILVFREYLSALKEYYGATFWAIPSPLTMVTATNWLFEIRHLGFLIAGAIAMALLYQMSPMLRGLLARAVRTRPAPTTWTAADGILLLGLIGVPAAGFVASMVGGSGMTERYLLPASIGGSIGLGFLLGALPRIAPVAVIGFTCVAYGFQIPRLAADGLSGSLADRRLSSLHRIEQALAKVENDGPVVISDGLTFLQAAYYLQPRGGRELVALIDVPAAVTFARTDSVDRGLAALRRYSTIRVFDYAAFAERQRTFHLVSTGAGFDWWPARLTRDGHRLTLEAEHEGARVYRVELTTGRVD